MDIGTTTDGLNTTTNVLEKRILDIFKTVIDPPAIALLFHEVRRLRQLQVPARVRLRDLERLATMSSGTFFDVQARCLLEGEPRAEKNALNVVRNSVGDTIRVRRCERWT